MKMKIKKKRLQEIINEEYARHESKKKLAESYDDIGLAGAPASRREHLGDAVADVLEDALKGFLASYELDPGVENDIMLDVEDKILDVSIAVSHALGTHASFGSEEMAESGVFSEDELSQAIAEILAEEDF